MTIKETFIKIKKGLDSGVYKTIRLVQVLPGKNKVLVPYNKLQAPDMAYKRLEHFKQVIEKDLPPGKYIIQAASHFVNSMITDFPIEVFKKKPIEISENPSGETQPDDIQHHETLEEEPFMDIEEYKKLLNQVSDLKSQVHMLELERDWFKKIASMENKQALADAPNAWTALADVVKEVLPPMVNMASDFFQHKRELADQAKQSQEGKLKVQRNPEPVQINTDQAINYYSDLYETDPDKFDIEFEKLGENNPELYNTIYDAMGFVEEEEEEEEQTGT